MVRDRPSAAAEAHVAVLKEPPRARLEVFKALGAEDILQGLIGMHAHQHVGSQCFGFLTANDS